MKFRLINSIIKLLTRLSFKKNKFFDLAIVKLDEIGDYILFRKNIERIRICNNRKILLIGNAAWKDLSLDLESDRIDKFIFIDKKKFSSSILYKFKTIKKLRKYNLELVIHPTQSRDFYISDYLVSILNAKNKIGLKSDLLNSTKKQLSISNKYYNRLVDCLDIKFELDKIENFMNLIFNDIDVKKKDLNFNVERYNYCVIFVGGSKPERRWGRYVELTERIQSMFDKIFVCGGDDILYNFDLNKNSNMVNLIGKSSLNDFRTLLEKSRLLITNESFPAHLATQVSTNCIVISNGNNYLRFHPYPKKHLNSIYKIIYPKSFDFNTTNNNLPQIDEIKTDEVLQTILKYNL